MVIARMVSIKVRTGKQVESILSVAIASLSSLDFFATNNLT